ncbi:DUF952 domain-containing protein [Hymenobacter jejuensis]|uniref:DUF952 domain-containing protein n=1 Tax=Hymenobacter jejuensis TaxID=2502781 RepID=A0A5B8A274_9BACT|nr:DUF952 domain-containing protein [Hymenobacter jejuensis]QDA61380.1 DUF952 domain-containing protein [Hymenobacter jejuensis]
MIYITAEISDWQTAQTNGVFASADLKAEGFIHSSERQQVLETARRYYSGRSDLLLLEIDEDRLATTGIRLEREWVGSRGEAFAHVFGPIPVAAVRRLWPFSVASNGTAVLPPDLEK